MDTLTNNLFILLASTSLSRYVWVSVWQSPVPQVWTACCISQVALFFDKPSCSSDNWLTWFSPLASFTMEDPVSCGDCCSFCIQAALRMTVAMVYISLLVSVVDLVGLVISATFTSSSRSLQGTSSSVVGDGIDITVVKKKDKNGCWQCFQHLFRCIRMDRY